MHGETIKLKKTNEIFGQKVEVLNVKPRGT